MVQVQKKKCSKCAKLCSIMPATSKEDYQFFLKLQFVKSHCVHLRFCVSYW